MNSIMYGCQTYTWQMNVEKFRGQMPHIVEVLAKAGFAGIEAEIIMLGDYYKDWRRFADLLAEHGVEFAALAIHEPWLLAGETEEERANADEAIAFCSHFPGAKLLLGHVAVDPVREHNLREKQDNHMKCVKEVGRRAAERGVVPVFHPNSSDNSIFRYWEDYEIMLDVLNTCDVGYAPDAGHMANGGIDPLEMIKYAREKVRHVHFKDMAEDHEWATMGTGTIDFVSIIDFLKETDYRGWIVTEDESPDAVADSDAVVRADGEFVLAHR